MRVGALLGAVAAARLGSIDAVVLWDPCASARSFVREQAALQRMRSDVQMDDTELPGFVFSAQTVADLGSLAVPVDGPAPSRVLLLTRPGRPAMTDLQPRSAPSPMRPRRRDRTCCSRSSPCTTWFPTRRSITSSRGWTRGLRRAERDLSAEEGRGQHDA